MYTFCNECTLAAQLETGYDLKCGPLTQWFESRPITRGSRFDSCPCILIPQEHDILFCAVSSRTIYGIFEAPVLVSKRVLGT